MGYVQAALALISVGSSIFGGISGKKDAKDEEIGIVGYEGPFNRHFYEYVPPRALTDIDEDLDAVSSDIMKLLQEVHS